ncbi:MerR family transcriptional regulator [Glycomyces albidus]|jgi:DNA-binding transcriptional MerR regulator|uniref:MerR family DNA-binding transcriptional regulator n=1 Tax=Glycomyces albidus TaxID=2656774 RepID=A0A6L5GCJ7_9ACTN|nr:MerR family transcriptional regulator [Glycomyces albidus]MQM27399.1 MerR family DNA-binding transcriptional regulator [Glycomyces albidus]
MTRDAARPEPGTDDGLTVGRAAGLVGVSVRTLHHWDAIGLVRPSGRTRAGYRVYSGEDVARIHRVLVYRELGFELAQIGPILDDPGADATGHLRRQRRELVEQIERLHRMVGAVDRMLEASRTGMRLTPEQQVAIFGDDWRPEWTGEAERRWGRSAQWAQYAHRAAGRSPADWERVAAETDAFQADLAAAKRSGAAPGSPEANALAERHRALMSTYFDCTHAMQVCMGRMFTEDAGFAAHYDGIEPGLARWLADVLSANAAANGVDPETAAWE